MSHSGHKIEIEYYTDPFSCWSWCNEPRIRKLKEEFGDLLEWIHVMGGLLPNASEISPAFIAEIAEDWKTLQRDQGVPIDAALWQQNPPKTTEVACQAYKAAQLQGEPLSEAYLRRLREAALTEKNSLDEKHLIVELAKTVTGMDVPKFSSDFDSPSVKQALTEDFAKTRSPLMQAEEVKETPDGQTRYAFPTMILRYEGNMRVISPFPTYEKYVRAILELKPDAVRHPLPALNVLLSKYQRLTTKEIEVIYQWSHIQALEQLECLWEERKLQKQPVGGDYFWLASSLVTV